MTPEQLAPIQQRADAAQPGPWSVTRSPYRGGDDPTAQVNVSSDLFDIASDLEDPDAEFIAHARADIPALLAAVRDAQQRAEQAEERARVAEQALARVRKLHRPRLNRQGNQRCEGCIKAYPCPTVRALDGEAAHG